MGSPGNTRSTPTLDTYFPLHPSMHSISRDSILFSARLAFRFTWHRKHVGEIVIFLGSLNGPNRRLNVWLCLLNAGKLLYISPTSRVGYTVYQDSCTKEGRLSPIFEALHSRLEINLDQRDTGRDIGAGIRPAK